LKPKTVIGIVTGGSILAILLSLILYGFYTPPAPSYFEARIVGIQEGEWPFFIEGEWYDGPGTQIDVEFIENNNLQELTAIVPSREIQLITGNEFTFLIGLDNPVCIAKQFRSQAEGGTRHVRYFIQGDAECPI